IFYASSSHSDAQISLTAEKILRNLETKVTMSTINLLAITSKARGLFPICCACLAVFARGALSAEPSLPAASPVQLTDTNSQETLMSILRLQEQLHATQLAIERNRQDAETAATRNAEALAGRLTTIEQALTAQRAQEWDAIQSSNKTMLIMAGL